MSSLTHNTFSLFIGFHDPRTDNSFTISRWLCHIAVLARLLWDTAVLHSVPTNFYRIKKTEFNQGPNVVDLVRNVSFIAPQHELRKF